MTTRKEWSKFKGRFICVVCGESIKKGDRKGRAVNHEEKVFHFGKDRKETYHTKAHRICHQLVSVTSLPPIGKGKSDELLSPLEK